MGPNGSASESSAARPKPWEERRGAMRAIQKRAGAFVAAYEEHNRFWRGGRLVLHLRLKRSGGRREGRRA